MVMIFNPVAGRRRAALLWRVLDVLVANGIRLDLAETHRAGHAEVLAREAVQGGAPMVVAAGGDGTIAEVANGLLGRAPGVRHGRRRGGVHAAERGGTRQRRSRRSRDDHRRWCFRIRIDHAFDCVVGQFGWHRFSTSWPGQAEP